MFLVNHEPWSLLDRFHQQLSNLSYSDSDSYYSNTSTGHSCPAVDIKEEKDRFLIIADIPGVSPTDIEIMMENGVLTIKGERHSQTEDNNETYFGTLKIIVKTCKESLPEDPPENSAFIQIWDKKIDQEEKKIFSGWMFSSSPSISAVDHAVYDVWVIDCMISYIED